MSKKVLNTQSVVNELKGQSAFFRKDNPKPGVVKKRPEPQKETPLTTSESPIDLPTIEKNATVNNASNRANKRASTLSNDHDNLIETIRKTVKQVGKDTLFVRLTTHEKHRVASAVFTLNEKYRGESRKTSENEIGRIGVNYILEDYKTNRENSILARVMSALHA